MSEEATLTGSPTLRVMPVVLFNLLVYLVIGLPNAIIGAQFVQNTLHFSAAYAASTLALQYIGTAMGRMVVGRRVDTYGPKVVLTYGLIFCAISGLLMCLAALVPSPSFMGVTHTSRYIALGIVLISRLFIGWSESCTATAVTTWNIRRVGHEHASVAISWNGVTSYGGIAIGASLGKLLAGLVITIELLPVGIVATALALGGLALLTFYKPIKPLPVKRSPMPFTQALRKVLPYGAGLAAGSIGFGIVSNFLGIYYEQHRWEGYSVAFLSFALVFILVRIFFADQIDKRGGVIVAYISLVTEAVAMAVFCLFQNHIGGIIGAALTGAGFSLLFPAMGTMAVKTDGPEFGGMLIAAYSIFTDVTIFLCALFMGNVLEYLGWGYMFALGGILCISGIAFSALFARIPGCGVPKGTR